MTFGEREGSRRCRRGIEKAQDLAGLRVPAELRLLEDGHAIACDLEPATSRWLESDAGVGKALLNRGRQTGGPRLVVSNRAVLDVDVHGRVWGE